MSSPNVRTFYIGTLMVSVYDYDEPGCTLPMHNHTELDAHIIIVQRGAVTLRITQPNGQIKETTHDATEEKGFLVDCHPGWPHEIVALSAGSRTIHIPKGIAR